MAASGDAVENVRGVEGIWELAESNASWTHEMLFSQYSQSLTRKLKRMGTLRKLRAGELANRAISGEDIVGLAAEVEIPPTELVRWILPHIDLAAHASSSVKVKDIVVQPSLVANAPLRRQILRAVGSDPIRSPAFDDARRLVGLEYEHRLQRMLRARGIPFRSEEELQREGAAKTPDVELPVPIDVGGRAVNWIDSKACFGDESAFLEHAPQFQAYINRFGPGMVIYWFGMSGLDVGDDRALVLSAGFPDNVRTMSSPPTASR